MTPPHKHWRPRLLRWLGNPASRVALGMVALMVMLILVVNMLTGGLIPDPTERARHERKLALQLMSGQVAYALQTQGTSQLPQVLAQSLQKHPNILSAAVVIHDGRIISTPGHAAFWQLAPEAASTLENMRSTLSANGQPWGELQLSFAPVLPTSVLAWLRQPLVLSFLALAALGFATFQLYLRRAMVYLDPSRVVPQRVRAALDILVEGILVLDTESKVMLANRAFGTMTGDHAPLTGRSLDSLQWLMAALQKKNAPPPWHLVLQTNQPKLGLNLELDTPNGIVHTVMNCSPISDGNETTRGCLVTLSNITELHERTESLLKTMSELEASREEIRLKNEELIVLATRDPLTGCLNRRAFATESTKLIADAENNGQTVCCVMCDIDHFKRINDTYGHAGGDLILQATAKSLAGGLRPHDLLARFGGEEFCILLPNTHLTQAREITERLRAEIEAYLGQTLRDQKNVRITMSFGIEQLGVRKSNIDSVIDLADQALYYSKQNGRNRVTAYEDLLQKDSC
ncbi:diguanylate cyclase [Azonexus sp.]|uniref:GGDEF domain-containing protein n=1 Tax=Azonexus sp. TaxID=1872668 RepID=UPI0039E4EE63